MEGLFRELISRHFHIISNTGIYSAEYKYFGEVTISEATELLDYIESNIHVIDHIDFRLFKECLSMISLVPPNNMWKKYVMVLLQNYR